MIGTRAPAPPTRRELLVGAAGLLVLAPYGCGPGDGAGDDADAVLVVNYSEEGQGPNFRALVESPLYRSLAAYEAYVIDGTETVGAAWARMGAFLGDLERILLAPDLDADVVRE